MLKCSRSVVIMGLNFFNIAMNSFMTDKEVVHQASCAGTPAQDGRMERRYRHLLSIARSLCFRSGLPIKYWGNCILTSTCIINRLPTPILDYKTLYECLYNSYPDYDLFKVFSCICTHLSTILISLILEPFALFF